MCDAPQVYALQQTVNSVFYIEILMCVKGSIQQKNVQAVEKEMDLAQ
jgi:hypothetical protein